jgi:hypothetical protein
MKDLNLLQCRSYRLKNAIPGILQFENKEENSDIKKIIEIMKVDAGFLRDKNLLDYSVLLGIEIIRDA